MQQKCTSKGEAIQCDLCCIWVYAVCEGIIQDQYKVIKSLSSLVNLVYHCKINNCINHFKNIKSEWIKCQACDTSQVETTVTKLTQHYLATEHDVLRKVVSDLSKIDNLHVHAGVKVK